MLRLLAPLFGFAVFGALFAGIYYEPDIDEESITWPKFRLAPGDAKPDFIEPAVFGENVTVNISVLTGGPVDIYLLDMENITFSFLNGTQYGFDVTDPAAANATYSRTNVTAGHNFTFVADGENRWALLFVSRVPMPDDWENLSGEEQEPYITELYVNMRYLDSEQKSLILGYLLATPSVLLVGYTLWAKSRRRLEEGTDEAPAYTYPRDRGL